MFAASVLKEKLSSLGSSGILADHHLQAQMQEHHLKGWVADSYVELAIWSEWTELCILICFSVWYCCANIFHEILLLFFHLATSFFSSFPMADQVMNHMWVCSKQRTQYYQGRLILVTRGWNIYLSSSRLFIKIMYSFVSSFQVMFYWSPVIGWHVSFVTSCILCYLNFWNDCLRSCSFKIGLFAASSFHWYDLVLSKTLPEWSD